MRAAVIELPLRDFKALVASHEVGHAVARVLYFGRVGDLMLRPSGGGSTRRHPSLRFSPLDAGAAFREGQVIVSGPLIESHVAWNVLGLGPVVEDLSGALESSWQGDRAQMGGLAAAVGVPAPAAWREAEAAAEECLLRNRRLEAAERVIAWLADSAWPVVVPGAQATEVIRRELGLGSHGRTR